MPELTPEEAAEALQRDGRFGWLVDGRKSWSVSDVTREYEEATGVPVSHDTVMRWFKRLPVGGAENYGGTIGWRAKREALIVFFGSGGHLRKVTDDDGEQVG